MRDAGSLLALISTDHQPTFRGAVLASARELSTYHQEIQISPNGDTGCGMDPATRNNIFEPFFTTKESGRGTGLGLSTVYGIVKQNDGLINMYSEPGLGTTFKVYLRRLADGANLSEKTETGRSAARGCETILLVEDEAPILKMTTMMPESLGYRVMAAKTPGEAVVRIAREHPGEIHLLIADVVMPEMNGRDLAKNILILEPDIKRLFMSGHTSDIIAHHGVLDEGVNFIQKPFSRQGVGARVRAVLDAEKNQPNRPEARHRPRNHTSE